MPVAAPRTADVTSLLLAWRSGDRAALDRLIPLIYTELRRVAHRYMRDERPAHPLQTTALVHEAYVRLLEVTRVDWESRKRFFAVSARLMRRIQVDAARRRTARKRGGDASHVALDEAMVPSPDRDRDRVALGEALDEFAIHDARKSRVVELRYVAGLSVAETAAVLGVSAETVMRDWRMVKLWLQPELSRGSQTARGTT